MVPILAPPTSELVESGGVVVLPANRGIKALGFTCGVFHVEPMPRSPPVNGGLAEGT